MSENSLPSRSVPVTRRSPEGHSPGMRQYIQFKNLYPGSVLFFQMGDFYELFFEDATEVAPLLDITLTSRSKKDNEPIPMCGVPLSSGIAYGNKLTEMGYTVVMCRQQGNAAETKGIVDRYVWQTGTPGMPLEDEAQTTCGVHYLTSIFPSASSYGLAYLEVSTGDLIMGQFADLEELRAELMSMSPHECLLPEGIPPEVAAILKELNIYGTYRTPEETNPELALDFFRNRFGSHAVEAWELGKWPEALSAASAVLDYALKCSKSDLKHLAPPRLLWTQSHLVLDEAALTNLEILKTLRHGELNGSLLGLMDHTATPMGGRLLRQWLARPLADSAAISARHGAVEELLRKGMGRDTLAGLLKKSNDLEKALSRTVMQRGGPRDLAVLRNTLALIPAFREALRSFNSVRLASLGDNLPDFTELTAVLEAQLVDEPPLNAKDGGLIKRGVFPELDELLDLEKGGKSGIAALEAREKERTGISSLKVGFNRVYGYFLEVTKSNLHLAPPDWIRKQTIAGGERYLTPELKEWEEKITHAGERRLALEEKILEDLKGLVSSQAQSIKEAAVILAEIDVLCSFAACAEKYAWVRPELTDEDLIDIKGGRHPVVEAMLPERSTFVANDVSLTTRERLLIITGPNMAGKSTILRQVALIVLMSQAGSFVPAEAAKLSIRDRIFTRVGASDDLARGRSTFMVEMTETARILAQATPRSLVVLDEVGRGTSTYDGLSLAWAIAEHLHDLGDIGVPTLFATHYHELVELAASKARVRNYNVAVKSSGGKVTFMRELKPGGVSRSYGLAVAAMAGLPKKVLDRAKEVMDDFSSTGGHEIRPANRQLGLFDDLDKNLYSEENVDPLTEELRDMAERMALMKPMEMTPLAALSVLNDLANEARALLEEKD